MLEMKKTKNVIFGYVLNIDLEVEAEHFTFDFVKEKHIQENT